MEIFAHLEERIQELSTHIEYLRSFRAHLSQDCFDTEDQEYITKKIDHVCKVKDQLEKTLAKKRDIYEKQIKSIENHLDSRRTQLERFDDSNLIFETFPEILEYFANKQNKLQEGLTAVKRKLQDD